MATEQGGTRAEQTAFEKWMLDEEHFDVDRGGSVIETVDLVKKALELGAIQVPEEISALVELLKKQRLRNIMEIGSEAGGTFYLWCRLTAIRNGENGFLRLSAKEDRRRARRRRESESLGVCAPPRVGRCARSYPERASNLVEGPR